MRRKTIGLLVDYLEMPYSGMLVEGCIDAAAKADVNLVIYPGTSINYNHTYSETDVIPERFSDQDVFQRTIVYEYAKQDNIDGLIIPIVTIGTCMSEDDKAKFMQSFGVPVMLLEQEVEGDASLVFEQNGISIILKHLIEEKNCKKIAYISGPLKNNEATFRLKDFKDTMASYGLEIPEGYIAYGDFTPFCQDVIEKMFAVYYKELDAIVVANDAMCIPLYQIMEKYGVIPGKDIYVTGYDNSDIALECEPRLTSINADVKGMARKALHALLDILEGKAVGAANIPIQLVKRASTGCEEMLVMTKEQKHTEGVHNTNSLKHVFINSIGTDMLSNADDLALSMESLVYDLQQAGFWECYLYLQEEAFSQEEKSDWNLPNRHVEQIYYNTVTNIQRIATGKKVDCSRLLASIIEDDRQHTLVCYPVRLADKHYGIFYLGYNISYNMDIYSVANQVATALHISSLVKQLASATEAKSNFLANMSHEIRTPINAVLGMDEMILRESKEAHTLEYASDIQTAGRILLSLINDILDISKIESGKMELVNVEYDLKTLLHDVMNMVMLKADEKQLYLKLDVEESIPSHLFGDDVRIRQILVNLLNNAVKYTNEGGVTLSLTKVRVESDTVCIRFAVQDTGIGIKKEDIAKLFERFLRIEEQRNRNVEGTGLGMSIAIRFLDLMNSQLQIESEPGKGSSFSFELVQRIIKEEPVGNIGERIQKRGKKEAYHASFYSKNANILVVDDNAINRKLFQQLLKETGIRTDAAANGWECLHMVKQKKYDVIFMDHMMPEIDGIETFKRMRDSVYTMNKGTKVVALTANAVSGARELYMEIGFDDYLTKPIVPEKLEQMLVELLPTEKVQLPDATMDGMDAKEEKSLVDVFFEEIIAYPEIQLEYARLFAPNDEFLRDSFCEFYKVMGKELGALQCFYVEYLDAVSQRNETAKEEALERYGLQVHAMKSSAAIVGAMNLNGLAYILEQAARESDHDTMVSLMPVFTKQWLKLKKKLAPCVEKTLKQVEI